MDRARRKGVAAENERSEHVTRDDGLAPFALCRDVPAGTPQAGALVRARAAAACNQAWYLVSGGAGAGVPAPVSSSRAATSARSPLASQIQTSRISAPSASRSVACRSSQTCSPSTRAELAVVASAAKQASPVGACNPRYCTVSCWPPTSTVRREPSRTATTVASSSAGAVAGAASPRSQRGPEIDRGLTHEEGQIIAAARWQQVEQKRLGGFARFDGNDILVAPCRIEPGQGGDDISAGVEVDDCTRAAIEKAEIAHGQGRGGVTLIRHAGNQEHPFAGTGRQRVFGKAFRAQGGEEGEAERADYDLLRRRFAGVDRGRLGQCRLALGWPRTRRQCWPQ